MIGQTIADRYAIEAIIGRGGMGTVYRATDLQTRQPVAVKLLNLGFNPGEQVPIRFYREFRVLTRLDHPHVVRAYDYGQFQGAPFLVLEFLEGQTLKELLAAGPLDRPRLLHIAHQICDALIHIHAHSLIHRDLKPGNVMLLPPAANPDVKLMDFGLVRLAQASVQLTREGSTLGTFAYMAPEQAQGLPTDFSADLYSLGIILYEMATGRPPFVADNPTAVLLKQVTATPPSPRVYNPALDEPLARLILQLLRKERRQRAASTRLVADRLARLADGSEAEAAVIAPVADTPPQVPLIGRDESLEALLEHWQEVRNGHGRVAVLSGPVGIGKDRLLTEMILNAGLGPEQVVRGRSLEHGALAYQPFVDILEAIVRTLPPSRHQTLSPQLGRLLPDLGELPALPSPSGAAESRLRLFAACWRLIREWAEDTPRLIVVDDVQWADENTVELLGYLAQRLAQTSLLLALTYRPDEVDPAAPVATLLRDWHTLAQVRVLDLPLLTRDQVATYLRAWIGQEQLPAWLVDSFHKATGGNPFFIEETLKVLAAEGQVPDLVRAETGQTTAIGRPGAGLQLPDTVLAIAQRRLQTLPQEKRQLLTRAAVLGPEFSFDLLQRMTGAAEELLLEDVDWLLAANFLEELPLQDGEDRFAFRQEALRQALLQTTSRRRRRLLHRQAGEAIQSTYNTNHPRFWPVLAHHFAEAGQTALALKYFSLAGDGAMRVYASNDAAGHYGAALALAREAGAGRIQWHHLYSRRGRALELGSHYQAALDNYLEMEEVAREQEDEELLLAALLARATILNTPTPVNDIQTGRELAEEALALACRLGDRAAEARAYWSLLINRSIGGAGRSAEAIKYGEASLAIAREHNLREQMAYTLNDLHMPYMGIGNLERAQAVIQEAQALWRELDNLPMLTDSLTAAAGSRFLIGDLDQARALAEEACAVSEQIDNLWGQAYSRWPIAYYWLEQGDFGRALSVTKETVRLAREAGMIYGLVTSLADLGWIYALLGAYEQALYWAREAERVVQESNFGIEFYPHAILGRIHILRGDLDEAAAALAPYGDKMRRSASWGDIWLLLGKIELALAREDVGRALALVAGTLAYMDEAGMETFRPDLLNLQARTLLLARRPLEARQALDLAYAGAQAVGSRRSLAGVLISRYCLERMAGESEVATAVREEARPLLTGILEKIDDQVLHASFRARPGVAAILGDGD